MSRKASAASRKESAVACSLHAHRESCRAAESLMLPRVRSVLAAPMEAQGKLAGVIYLDASSVGVHFDAGLLQLVLARGNIAGVTLRKIFVLRRRWPSA